MIYTRIDTYSCILYSVSIREILNKFNIDHIVFSKAFSKGYEKSDVKTGTNFVVIFNGLRLECKVSEYHLHENAANIIDVPWSWLRLYISGEGIDYLESSGIDLHSSLSDPCYWQDISEFCKITRVDFAYDFINYEGNEFERLRKILANAEFDVNLSEGGRLFTGDKAGITYQYRGGKERTIYLGSPGSDRLLRIYDKKFQLTSPEGCFDTSRIPPIILNDNLSIETWYRVELQCRDELAARYLYSSNGDLRYVMGEISSYFDVRKKDGKYIPPLHKIFLWTQRVPIIQNANCSKPRTELEVTSSWLSSIASTNILCSIGALSWEGFRQLINSSVSDRMNNMTAKQKMLYLNKINSKISVIAQQEGLTFDSNGNIGDLIKGDDGAYYLAAFPKDKKIGPYV